MDQFVIIWDLNHPKLPLSRDKFENKTLESYGYNYFSQEDISLKSFVNKK